MSHLNKIKIILLFYCLGSMTLLSAQTSQKKYDVQSAIILYNISGGGQLAQDVNLTIKGKGKMRFKDWGAVELFEEEIEEITSGTLSNIETITRCIKRQKKKRLDVDFKTKKILERSMPKGNVSENITKGLVKQGQEIIAGQTCDIWEGNGVRKCIYKGIPLLVENSVLGMHYQRKAVSITENIKASAEKCTIPDFPVQKFALLKTNIKTKSKKVPKEFSEVLMDVSKEMYKQLNDGNMTEANLTVKQKKVWLEKLGQNVFEKQKVLLPEMLLSMQKARECLAQAKNWIDANVCLEDVASLKSQFSKDKDSNIESWKKGDQDHILDDFDENIALLKSKMPCIRSAKNIADLSACMK